VCTSVLLLFLGYNTIYEIYMLHVLYCTTTSTAAYLTYIHYIPYIQNHLRPHLNKFIPILAANMNPKLIAVCNNASWAVGEIVVKVGAQMKPYVDMILQRLIPIVNSRRVYGLLENTAITIGRLGIMCPREVGKHLSKFARVRLRFTVHHIFYYFCCY